MKNIRGEIKLPNNARIAVIPAVTFEAWPDDLGRPNSLQNEDRKPFLDKAIYKRDLSVVTDREYGERVGIYRLLDIFDKEGVRTTFFINGILAEISTALIKEIYYKGHEIASESYIHDYSFMKTENQEREDLKKTVKAIQKVLNGDRPLGFLSTGIRPTTHTPFIVADEGYEYWVDPQNDDFPYTLNLNDNKELVVISYLKYLNDYSTYRLTDRTPRQLLEIWKDTFDYLYMEGAENPAVMLWGIHPFITGRPYRAKILYEFISYAKSFQGVWFTRCIDVAKWWKNNYRDRCVEKWKNY